MTKHHTLGPRTEQVLAYIRLFSTQYGRPPGYEEIAEGVGMKTSSVVAYHIRLLTHAGLIEIAHDGSRAIRLLPGAEELPVLRYAVLHETTLTLPPTNALEIIARLVQLWGADEIAQAAQDCERQLGAVPKLAPESAAGRFVCAPLAALAEVTHG